MEIIEKYLPSEDTRDLISEGIYHCECISYQSGYYERIPKLYLFFKMLNIMREDDPNKNVILFMPFSMPFSNDGIRRIGAGSKYYRTWALVNRGLPSRNAKMSPRLFLNKTFKVTVKTVKPKQAGIELPDFLHYSIIQSIIEEITL